MRRWLTILIAASAFSALSGVAAYHKVRAQEGNSPDAHWREIAWPFPRDAWPAGRAFRCDAASCGGMAEIYVRPKIGFCNCDTGVADDDEVDRVADLDLISERFVPVEAGRVVRVADMSGRWPNASYVEDMSATQPYAARVFDPTLWRADQPLRVVMIGTDFQVRVWEALLRIPMGKACTYSSIATSIGP